jgi:hypothetical protein
MPRDYQIRITTPADGISYRLETPIQQSTTLDRPFVTQIHIQADSPTAVRATAIVRASNGTSFGPELGRVYITNVWQAAAADAELAGVLAQLTALILKRAGVVAAE